ncbi:hypothetical protein J6590_026955 [Homalodisca vitripennis]|nr:hypothetical protein J6590_026955 [Homalodisca vitripennis]
MKCSVTPSKVWKRLAGACGRRLCNHNQITSEDHRARCDNGWRDRGTDLPGDRGSATPTPIRERWTEGTRLSDECNEPHRFWGPDVKAAQHTRSVELGGLYRKGKDTPVLPFPKLGLCNTVLAWISGGTSDYGFADKRAKCAKLIAARSMSDESR